MVEEPVRAVGSANPAKKSPIAMNGAGPGIPTCASMPEPEVIIIGSFTGAPTTWWHRRARRRTRGWKQDPTKSVNRAVARMPPAKGRHVLEPRHVSFPLVHVEPFLSFVGGWSMSLRAMLTSPTLGVVPMSYALARLGPAETSFAEEGSMTEQDDRTASFRTTGLFAEFELDDADALLGAGEAVSVPAGQAIFETGDQGDAMYVILSGEAQVDVGGRFHVLRAGDFFGEMAVLAPGKRMATVRADGEVQALRISAERFQEFLLQRPRVALSMMKALVLRLREVEQRIDAWMA